MKLKRGNIKAAKALLTIGAVAALAGGCVALSGCGASATLDPLARAAEVTSQQSGARISLSMKFSAPGLPGGNSIAMTADGYFDERKRTREMTIDLSGVRAISGAVVSLGSQSINGVPSTHYSATLQMSRILDRLPGDQQAAAKAALEKLGSAGNIPVEVWVDSQGRVRRMQMSLSGLAGASGPAAAAAAGIGGSITIDFKSYGAGPAVVAPPASEVFDMSKMLKAG